MHVGILNSITCPFSMCPQAQTSQNSRQLSHTGIRYIQPQTQFDKLLIEQGSRSGLRFENVSKHHLHPHMIPLHNVCILSTHICITLVLPTAVHWHTYVRMYMALKFCLPSFCGLCCPNIHMMSLHLHVNT